jgi:non-heme chloroperoxidase
VRNLGNSFFLLIAFFILPLEASAQTDSSAHRGQFVTVEPGVQLEVLDWGGSGRPLIFLAGAGDTAHRFDSFAPQFTAQHHVYGITRKGFGHPANPRLLTAIIRRIIWGMTCLR